MWKKKKKHQKKSASGTILLSPGLKILAVLHRIVAVPFYFLQFFLLAGRLISQLEVSHFQTVCKAASVEQCLVW